MPRNSEARTAGSQTAGTSGGMRSDMGPMQDPTALTTQQLLRENFWLRELLQEQIAGLLQRMDAGDKAVGLLQAFADRTPTTMDVQHQVSQLREVTMDKIAGINKAVDAAFAASKEVIAKSEASFTKQIDSFSSQIGTNLRAVHDKIDDIKERLTVIESKTSVSDPSTAINLAKLQSAVDRLTSGADFNTGTSQGRVAMWGMVLGGLGFLVSAVIAATAVMKLTTGG